MNKYLLQILLAVVLVGCSRNDDWNSGEVTEGGDIQFNISVPDASTRAAIINSRTELDGKSVGLYAFMVNADDNTKYMRAANVKLTYNKAADTWEYSDLSEPLKWDFEHTYDRFSFYVYYPFDENATNVNFDMETAAFSVDYDAVADKDVDVMIAELENITYPQGGVITLDLKHVLSAIAFNTDYSKPIADVKFCSGASYTTMPKSGTASLVGGTVQWDVKDYYTSDYSYQIYSPSSVDPLVKEKGNYVLIIPQTITNKGDLYFSMSYSDGVTAVDNGAQAPAGMEFKAGQIYTFKYKGSFAEVGDDGELIIDLEEYRKWEAEQKKNGTYVWGDYSSINEILDEIKNSGEEIKVTVRDEITNNDQAHWLLQHIVDYFPEENPVIHVDFSQVILPMPYIIPYQIFDDPKLKNALKTLKLPPLVDNSQLPTTLVQDCISLESIEFAEGSTITTLSDKMCEGCTSLKEVNLEVLTKLETISQDAFLNCTGLETITIPKSVTTIGYQSFMGCTSLSNIVFEENSQLKIISQHTFRNCTALQNIVLPASLQEIQSYGFGSCSKLESVLFENPSQLVTIQGQAFNSCSSLNSINIPASVTTIGWQAFFGCTTLTNAGVVFEGDPNAINSVVDGFNGCPGVNPSNF